MIKVTITGDKELNAKLTSFPQKLREKLFINMSKQMDMLRDYIREGELSGQILNVRSADLKNSIQDDVTASDSGVRGEVFSATVGGAGFLPYARALNDGCGPYDIYPVKAQALAWPAGKDSGAGFSDFYGLGEAGNGGEMIFAKVVHHPGQWPRQFMEAGLAYRKEAILDAIASTMKETWMEAP